MIQKGPIVQVNSSTIPVAGLGGVGLLAVAAVIAVVFPEARFILLAGGAGGLPLALFWIAARRRGRHSRPSGDSPAVLFRTDAELTPVRPSGKNPIDGRQVAGTLS